MKKSPLPDGPQKLIFLLDYDGTLADFGRDPEKSVLPLPYRNMLIKLRKKHPVVLVSGRYLKSLVRVSGLKNFPMAGTHGFESRKLPGGLRLATRNQERKYKREASALWTALQPLFRDFPEIHIEKKPFSSTLHYRGIDLTPKQVKDLRSDFFRLFSKAVDRRSWSLMEGKKMIEAMPKGFNKGQAVRKILKHFPGYRPVYAGDDITDLSAFKALGKNGFKVAVGKRIPRSYCDLRLSSTMELLEWLGKFS